MATNALSDPTAAGQSGLPYVGAAANDGNGDDLRTAITYINDLLKDIHGSQNASNVVQTPFVDGDNVKDDTIEHKHLSARYTDEVSITDNTGTVEFDCSTGSVFKLDGDLTGAYTIDLTGYKKGQIITIYPLKGNQTLNLDAQGTSTNTFNKIGGVDYEDNGTDNNIMQIECVDDSATDPIFFYSIATYASDSSDI